MIVASPVMTANWNDEQRALFQAQMSAWQKDEVVGVLLALFLGTFGAHQFYLRRPGLGILYIVFLLDRYPYHRQLRGMLLHARPCPPVQPGAGDLFRRPARSRRRDCDRSPGLANLPVLRMRNPRRSELLRPLRYEYGSFRPNPDP